MLFDPTKIKKKIEVDDFVRTIKKYKIEEIECTIHTFMRLSQKQRKIFTCDELKEILMKDTPFWLEYSIMIIMQYFISIITKI